MVRGRPRSRSPRLLFGVIWIGALVAVVALAPRLVEGYGALQWTRFQAARAAGPRPGEHVRKAGRAAARAIDFTAPLPWAGEAARLALDAAGGVEAQNRASAAAAYAEVRAALDRATASPVRGLGLSAVATIARERDDAARAAATSKTP